MPSVSKTGAKPRAAGKISSTKSARQAARENSPLFMAKDEYKHCIDGLMAQGLEHRDAVDTLKVGLRQANGRPVPLELLMHQSTDSAQAVHAA
ncbi:hypothetical protein D3C71_20340 [compost metagenome]